MAARKNTQKPMRRKALRPKPLGWNTTDEDEIAQRIARANKESFEIESADGDNAIFSDWLVTGESGEAHRIEIRSIHATINSCGCKDFQVNGLGTCKHIEAMLNKLRKRKRGEREKGHPDVEIYFDRRDLNVKISFPDRMRKNTRARQVVAGYFDETDSLRGDPLQSMAALKDKLIDETTRVHRQVRISPHLEDWLLQLQQAADQRAAL